MNVKYGIYFFVDSDTANTDFIISIGTKTKNPIYNAFFIGMNIDKYSEPKKHAAINIIELKNNFVAKLKFLIFDDNSTINNIDSKYPRLGPKIDVQLAPLAKTPKPDNPCSKYIIVAVSTTFLSNINALNNIENVTAVNGIEYIFTTSLPDIAKIILKIRLVNNSFDRLSLSDILYLLYDVLVEVVGFEPTIFGIKNHCLTAWPHLNTTIIIYN